MLDRIGEGCAAVDGAPVDAELRSLLHAHPALLGQLEGLLSAVEAEADAAWGGARDELSSSEAGSSYSSNGEGGGRRPGGGGGVGGGGEA
eukprot:882631-Prymnesium_polylepis.1